MQYYYECLEVYEKLLPEVKKHCKFIKKCDAQFIVARDKYLHALQEFEDQKEHMSLSVIEDHKNILEKAHRYMVYQANEKINTSQSLMVTIEYYLTRINGYVREFRCDIDMESPGTSIELEKKFMELNRKRLKEIQDLREEYPDVDNIFKIPEAEAEPPDIIAVEPLPDPKEVAETKINGHRQNIRNVYNKLISGLTDEQPGMRNVNSRKTSLKIKTERRGSMTNGTPSPRAISPRLPRVHKFSTTETTLTVPEQGPASTSVSPMEVSPGPHGNNMSFSYSENNLSQFSTMPSFSGSQESRHGRQRKFTQKAQQMFKENKLGPGRPSNHHYQPNFQSSIGNEHMQSPQQLPQINNSNNNQTSQLKSDSTIHPIASSSYSFPQDYARLTQPTSQQQYIYTTSPFMNSHAQIPPPHQITLQQPRMQPTQQQSYPQQYFQQGPQVRLTVQNGNNTLDAINDNEEDDSQWCFCGEQSYGNMIACEYNMCPYKWFHYQCVGISKPPTGLWYCPECRNRLPS